MAQIGFVYILVNGSMSCFKIGCTERSPHARAAELSASSGVPEPFEVACYVEADRFQDLERELHAALADHRVNEQREFFFDRCLREAVARLFNSPSGLSFCSVGLCSMFADIDGRDGDYPSVEEIFRPSVGKEAATAPSTAPRLGFFKRLKAVA